MKKKKPCIFVRSKKLTRRSRAHVLWSGKKATEFKFGVGEALQMLLKTLSNITKSTFKIAGASVCRRISIISMRPRP